jgi:VWFA-related protein
MRRNRLRRALRQLTVLIGILTAVTCLQAQAPSPSEVPAPTIRVSTHLVLVDVVVTDKQGKAIPGLRPEDFVVEENGKQQKISTFATPAENNVPSPALPPGIYTNKAQYRSPGGPITVMLLDVINTPFKDQAYAHIQMLKFVQQNFKPDSRMGIFTLTGSLNVLQDFTSDPQVLYAALQHFRPLQNQYTPSSGTPPAGPAGATDSGLSPVSDASTSSSSVGPRVAAQVSAAESELQAFADVAEGYSEDQRILLTLNALNSLSRILGGLPGRKNVIWVTGDIPLSLIPEDRTVTKTELEEDLPSMNTRRVDEHASGNYAATARTLHAEEIRETAARLSSSQIAIYPVDARGLTLSTDTDSQEQMREIARETGGRAYVNQNEIKVGVERAFQDQTAAYTIGYYPENKKYDGKYRNIKVKVKKDGVDVQNRKGYFAIDPTQVKGYDPQQEVARATTDVVPSTMVAFTARVVPASANKGKVGVDFLVDASTLSVQDSGGNKQLNVAFYATAFAPDGKMGASLSKKVDQAFDNSTYQQILQHGLLLHMDMDAPPPNSRVHLAVQDGRTGLVGTINAPVGK